MNRMTVRDKSGTISKAVFFDDALERLAAYEDTGLEPHEILCGEALEKTYDSIRRLNSYKRLGSTAHFIELVDEERKRKEEQDIYRLAIDTYGSEDQILMMFEEMSELQKELCKYHRGKNNMSEIAEEIADVLIMAEQMAVLFGRWQDVMEFKDRKIRRLKKRLILESENAPG